MSVITGFLSHYAATYAAYIQSPVIWIAFAVYVFVILSAIFALASKDKLEYFPVVLFFSLGVLTSITTYTFISLW